MDGRYEEQRLLDKHYIKTAIRRRRNDARRRLASAIVGLGQRHLKVCRHIVCLRWGA